MPTATIYNWIYRGWITALHAPGTKSAYSYLAPGPAGTDRRTSSQFAATTTMSASARKGCHRRTCDPHQLGEDGPGLRRVPDLPSFMQCAVTGPYCAGCRHGHATLIM